MNQVTATDDLGENPVLSEVPTKDTPIKEWLVNYVGEKHNPTDDGVTVDMIVETLANEFPEFVLAVAEENFLRGYKQALMDVESSFQQQEASKENE